MTEDMREPLSVGNDSGPDEFINYDKKSSSIMRPKFSKSNMKKQEIFEDRMN